MTVSTSIWKQWGTSILFHFLSFSCLSFPRPLPSCLSLHVKSARTWCLVKGMDTVHRPWAICSPWLKGSVNIFLAKYWYQFNERCHLVACLSQNCVCVCVLFNICACLAIRQAHGQWQCRLISSPPPLLSWVCIFIIQMTVCVYVCVCVCGRVGICVFPSACVTLFMCLCIKHVDVSDFAAPKWLGGQTCYQM